MPKYIKSNDKFEVTNDTLYEIEKLLHNEITTFEPYLTDDGFGIEIFWGDWKHDHARADYLIRQYFENLGYRVNVNQYVTEEDGSDTYSAQHNYRIY